MQEIKNIAFEHLRILGYSFFYALISVNLARVLGFFYYPNEDFPARRIISLNQLFIGFSIFLGTQLILVPGIVISTLLIQGYTLQQIETDPFIKAAINILAILTALSFLVLYSKYQDPRIWLSIWRPRAFMGLKRDIKDFIIGVATWIVCFPVVVALGQIISLLVLYFYGETTNEQVAVEYLKMVSSDPLVFGVLAVCIVVIVPVLEELLFRGFLQTWLRGIMGPTPALIVASLIFSGFHFSYSQGVNNIELISSLFVLSCFLGFLYERQNSLVAPIGLHIFFNMGSVIMILRST